MEEVTEEVKQLYEQIATLTKPRCANCVVGHPYNCCSAFYCDFTDRFAKHCGVELEASPDQIADSTGKVMKFMSKTGCIVEPYMRPLCSVHVCEGHLIGTCSDGCDETFNDEYWDLRQKVNELDLERFMSFSERPNKVVFQGYVENGVPKPLPDGISTE